MTRLAASSGTPHSSSAGATSLNSRLVAALLRLWHSSPICTAWAMMVLVSMPPSARTALSMAGANSSWIHARRSITPLSNAPKRSTLPRPSFTVQNAVVP